MSQNSVKPVRFNRTAIKEFIRYNRQSLHPISFQYEFYGTDLKINKPF
jgi:hypothetical protein